MEDFLELILTILLTLFEPKKKEIISGINHIRHKPLRVFVKIFSDDLSSCSNLLPRSIDRGSFLYPYSRNHCYYFSKRKSDRF